MNLSLSEALKKEKDRLKSLLRSKREIHNISLCSLGLALVNFDKKYLIIEENEEYARRLYNSVRVFSDFFNTPVNAVCLVSEGVERNRALIKIINFRDLSVITTKEALLYDSEIERLSFSIKTGQEHERERLQKKLLEAGYSQVEMVVQQGEFCHHGWVFDIWNIEEDYPVRVEFFGEQIEEIKYFYPDTQSSFKNISEIQIIPCIEGQRNRNILEHLSFEILITANLDFVYTESSECEIIKISHLPYQFFSSSFDAGDRTIAGLGIMPHERKSIFDFPKNLKALNIPLLLVLSSAGKARTVKEILFSHDIVAPVINKSDVGSYSGKYAITVEEIEDYLFRDNLIIITDSQIFSEKPGKKKKPSLKTIPSDGLEIKEGDYVVHREHGIGMFRGIKRQHYEDSEEDVLVIEYKDGDILYVPTWSIEKIYRYSAKEGFIPQIDKLGTNRWQRLKERERKKIHDVADKLLQLYAQRKAERDFIYSEDEEIHRNFDDFFPYEETEDQQRAIEAVLKKMRQPYPIDVLLCGDAGYGKTEVAMRAAFRAVYDKKQVAVLVPTTLLCEQHYRTFKRRFEAFPVRIDYLDRFRSSTEIGRVIEDVKSGKVDILIGTHMMLMKNVDFFDLGLLIIDEEQKFGVIQKEKLKERFPKVDLITITATPIPRTLQMGLSGLWDIFIIQTPPRQRLAVKSFIISEDYQLIKEAIERELKRGGQVYFLHNRIEDIGVYESRLKGIFPDARIAVVHGRMKERDIDRIMLLFIDGKIDILICTSIIASGIDIPNVNTIIINRAELFGLSDLYQIRGRVGRSDRQAYAYFIIPKQETLTDSAKKRIKAISEMSYLGAGFHIALKDLEIRGAGQLLGVEQSGINRLGFDLYIEMLNEAIGEIKGEVLAKISLPEVKINIPAFIPESYIEEIPMRIRIYRKLSQSAELSEIDRIYEEVFDRFGKLPEEVENLFKVARIRILASKIKISKIQQKRTSFMFTMDSNLREDFIKKMVNILTWFLKREIVREIKFHQDGFEVWLKDLEQLILLLKRLSMKLLD